MKYGVIMVHGDDIQVLETCATKEDVLTAKQVHREKHKGEDCHIASIEGKFDNAGNLMQRSFRILY